MRTSRTTYGAFLATALLLCNAATAEVKVTQTTDRIVLSNGMTTLSVKLDKGQAAGLDLIECKSNRALARIELGDAGRWTAACTAESKGDVGHLVLKGQRLDCTVELRQDNPFPFVNCRLKPGHGKKGAAPWTTFLSCRMDSAQFFYRGGFLTALPPVDPFPSRSAAMAAPGRPGWLYRASMAECPVPAVGLWDAEHRAFVAYEFQEARSAANTSGRAASTCLVQSDKNKRQCFGLPASSDLLTARFRILYSVDLSAADSPNQFVLRHIYETYRDRLPAAPDTNDLGWMPKRGEFLPDNGTTAALVRRITKNSLDEESLFFTGNTLVPCGDYRGVLNLLENKADPRRERLLASLKALKEKAVRKRIGKDDCVLWRFPLEGNYEPIFGGEAAAAEHSPATWRIGACCLAVYRCTGDKSLLPLIDGVFRWTRHCLATRAGDPALPGAASVTAAHECAAEFLLNFHHAFRNDKDAARRAMAQEAIVLGRSAIYRTLAIYTGDPDPTDNLDPTFLIQADSARNSAGTVSWAGTDRLIRAMALYHVETGDAMLGYFVRGALLRRPLGVEADGLHTVETLGISGRQPGSKGRRSGFLAPSEALAEYFQPISPAKLRVVCGPKAALAFCADAALEVRDYRFAENGDIRFDVAGDVSAPVTLNVTTPLRDLRGKKIVVNGQPVEAEIVGRHGENAVMRGVSVKPAAKPAPAPVSDSCDEARLVPLPWNTRLDTSWAHGRSWAGLVGGLHHAWGVPFRIACGKAEAVDLSKGTCTTAVDAMFRSGFVFASAAKPPMVTIVYADGKSEERKLERRLPALSAGPIRAWRVDMHLFKPSRPDAKVKELRVSGEGLLFALTIQPGDCPAFDAALAREESKRKSREAEAEAARRLKLARERLVPESRAKVAQATRGKTLRIAFLPPHEAYTKALRTACSSLGCPSALLSPGEVIDPKQFNPDRYPIAVYSASETFLHTVKQPGDAAAALKKYVAGGGCLIVAGRGFPFYYAMRPKGDTFERIKGLRNGETCAALQVLIAGRRVPPLEEIPRYELVPGQKVFAHLPQQFRYERVVGGPYRPITGEGLPKEDVFQPVMVLKDGAGKEHGAVAAVIEHKCREYKGGRVIFLWGNILAMETGPTIALDLMSYAICSAKLKPGAAREPMVAILPRDMGGHDKAVEQACAAAGVKAHKLTPEEFVDPAVFNPRNFPVAVHAVGGEYYLDRYAERGNLWQTYVDYVKGGGFLIACGNMYQFFYAGTLTRDGKYTQRHDGEYRILDGLGLRGGGPRLPGGRPMFLQCLPDQDILSFKSPMPLEYLNRGCYRSIDAAESFFDRDFVPLARVVDGDGTSYGGYAAAVMRFKSRHLKGAEMLWMWGNLLNDARAHPLLTQAVRYACERRKAILKPGK